MADKKRILLECAREVFAQKGFKDTNVLDITGMAGVAAGTFYNYYPSKDKLFMEIYADENAKLKKHIMEQIDMDGDPLDVMKQMLYLNEEGMRASAILREWYKRDVFSRIEKAFREEKGLDHIGFMYECFLDIVKRWQQSGKMRSDLQGEMIMAVFAALISIDLHKDEIGLEYFPQVLNLISEYVMRGLTQFGFENVRA
jgi:AcrR family transcriptional regulator